MSLAYQRVQKVDCTSLRPVLILGPLLDVVKEMLVNEAPGKFCRCPLGKGTTPAGLCLSLCLCPPASWGWIPPDLGRVSVWCLVLSLGERTVGLGS